tara:strand:+ start:1217 stop:1576 length:360 start_codon:yes stop_codon:yes gene_type:complete
MEKKDFNYKNLSSKELEYLKDIYIDQKVRTMDFNELKNFVSEHISLQIKSTIGHDEELEAWQEMENFFKDEFENTINSIQIKFNSNNQSIHQKQNDLAEKIKSDASIEKDNEKKDMWED